MVICDYPGCGKVLSSNYSLQRHKKRHLPQMPRPWRCLECGFCFTEKSTLNRHLRTHTGTLFVKCNVCGLMIERSKMIEHIQCTGDHREVLKAAHLLTTLQDAEECCIVIPKPIRLPEVCEAIVLR